MRKIPTMHDSLPHSTRPFWVDPDESRHPNVGEDISVEVAVIGGGIAGLGTAYWLRRRGVDDVAVLEARTIASGASGRNAGFVMAVAPENFPATDNEADLRTARRIWEFTAENQRMIEAVISEFSIEAEYRTLGSLGLAASEDEWNWIVTSTNRARDAGLKVQIVDREALPSLWVRENYFGGAWYSGNSEIHPGKFVRGLAQALERERVQIFERSPVEALESHNTHIALKVNGGVVRATNVIIATNAYTDSVSRVIGSKINPTRGQVIATSPVGAHVAPCPVYANRGFQYWRQTPSGRLILGGWRDLDIAGEVGTSEFLNPAIHSELECVASALTGGEAQIEFRWSGTMGFTPDQRPLVGLVPDNGSVSLVAGFSGHGLAMAFHASSSRTTHFSATRAAMQISSILVVSMRSRPRPDWWRGVGVTSLPALAKRLSEEWRTYSTEAMDAEALMAGTDLLSRTANDRGPTMHWFSARDPAVVVGPSLAKQLVASRSGSIPVVRRPSGGGAVLVGPGVLGLDIALPRGHRLVTSDVVKDYQWLGELWAAALSRLGFEVEVVSIAEARKATIPPAIAADVSLACFASLSPYEVTFKGKKVVGLSQVRRAGGVTHASVIHIDSAPSDLSWMLTLSPERRTALAKHLDDTATRFRQPGVRSSRPLSLAWRACMELSYLMPWAGSASLQQGEAVNAPFMSARSSRYQLLSWRSTARAWRTARDSSRHDCPSCRPHRQMSCR